MFKIDKDGLARNEEGTLVAIHVDRSKTALGVESQSDHVILRLYLQEWEKQGDRLARHQMHQFVLLGSHAERLGRQLLELAAQIEKESGKTAH